MQITARMLVGAIALAGPSCTPAKVFQPASWATHLEHDAGLDSAVLLDERRVLFSWSSGRFRYIHPDPLWGRGQRQYLHDERLIGVYDLETGEGRVLVSDARNAKGDGNGEFMIVSARGSYALVFRKRLTMNGIMVQPSGYFLLDVERAALTPIDVNAELAEFDRELSTTPWLVDGEGTLLYQAGERCFLRRREGEVQDLGVGGYAGIGDGRVLITRRNRGGADAYHPRTGAMTTLTNRERSEVRDTFKLGAIVYVNDAKDGVRLTVGSGDDRVTTEVEIDVEALR